MNKREVEIIDATPSKRVYRAIIADYSLNTAVCELIDNAIDAAEADAVWKRQNQLNVAITVNLMQRNITIRDNAGGVTEAELRKLISPGETSLAGTTPSIGIFGVGSKRAVVALAQNIAITTRYHRRSTFLLEYDDAWLKDPDWHLPVYGVPDVDPGTTEVKLSNLRFPVEENDVAGLRDHLSLTYARFVQDGRLRLLLDGVAIAPRFFDQWAYPPEWSPKGFSKWLSHGGKRNIRFQVVGGLTIEGGSIGGDYGVFFYCNDRLIVRASRTPELGFSSGVAGVPHPRMSLARIIVDFKGPSAEMPWISNKSAINYTHAVFRDVQKDVVQMVKGFTALSKSLQQDFEDKVAKYPTGSVQVDKLGSDDSIRPSLLPPIPPSVPNYQDQVENLNNNLTDRKPWTRGLYEGVLAFNVVKKQTRLKQKNRIALIILDSTLEIAFKEYLANEVQNPMGDERLAALFKDRTQVHSAVESQILTGDPIWGKIRYYYRLRCDLIHKRASAALQDDAIEDYRRVVVKFLYKAFKVRFPS